MFKIIAMVRVSSDIQETASQKEALKRHILSLGFEEDEILWHEIKASATKAGRDYQEFISGIQEAAISNNIKNIAVYHLNRIGRREEYLFGFKRFCVENRIQLYCMEPAFKLLDENGEVNPTSDMIYNMFISFVISETKEREAKLLRGKRHNHLTENKYCGGFILYGYKVDTEGYMVIDKEEAENVQRIFDMYASGNYSGAAIAHELNLKNVKRRGGKWYPGPINKMLGNECYAGGQLKNGFTYQAIVSRDLFDQCQKVKKKNLAGEKSKDNVRINLGTGIIRCLKCGRRYIAMEKHYMCVANHNSNYLLVDRCKSPNLNMKVTDGILWHIARPLFLDNLMKNQASDNLKIDNEIEDLRKMIDGLDVKREDILNRRRSLEERYYSGRIEMNENRFNELLEANSNEAAKVDVEKDLYQTRIEILQTRKKLNNEPELKKFIEFEKDLDSIKDRQMCRNIIRSVIEEVNVEKMTEAKGSELMVTVKLLNGGEVYVRFKFRSRIKFEGDTVCGHISSDKSTWFPFITQNLNSNVDGYEVKFNPDSVDLVLRPELRKMFTEWKTGQIGQIQTKNI